MHPQQPVMGRSAGYQRLRLAQMPVHFLKALQEPWYRAGTDGDKLAHFYIAVAQLAGHKAEPLFGGGIFDPEEIFGQQLAKAAMDLGNALRREGVPAFEPAAVDPLLDNDMSPGFHLQVALVRVVAEVVLE